METRIVRHTDIHAFSAQAAPWLLRIEAEHNLLLGMIAQLRAGEHPSDGAPYLVTVEQAGAVVGCAIRTPPQKLVITRMPSQVIPALAADVGSCFDSLPAVLGPESTAREFGRCWALRHDGVVARPGMRQRLYALRSVRPLARSAPGAVRSATPDDLPLILEWISAFGGETGVDGPTGRHARSRIESGDLVLWDADGPCSMAGVAGRSRNGSRIGYVYTPPELRGRGYASACVAELTRRELALGAAFCCLYTDLSNATSNSIYQQIGYEPVCDFVDVVFAAA